MSSDVDDKAVRKRELLCRKVDIDLDVSKFLQKDHLNGAVLISLCSHRHVG